jgi:hypothetical protein
MARIKQHLVTANHAAIEGFFDALKQRLGRNVTRVVVIPLYGRINEFTSIEEAIRFLDGHMIYEGSAVFRRYEILVEFSNGDRVEAFMESKEKVKEFLDFIARQ